MMKSLRMVVVGAVLAGTLSASTPARAGYLEEAGWGSLTMLANVAYMPAKLVYATLGGLTGGLAYACTAGNLRTAENVWSTSMGGTYVLTPPMLRGQQGITFAAYPGHRQAEVADAATDPMSWPAVDVEDDDFAGTTFSRSSERMVFLPKRMTMRKETMRASTVRKLMKSSRRKKPSPCSLSQPSSEV